MAVPVIETTALTSSTSDVTSLVCTAPSGIVDDDIILILAAFDGGAAFPTSTGFTEIVNSRQGTAETYMLYKRASSESGNYTVNWTGAENARIELLRISGCITTGDPTDVIGTTTTTVGITADVNAITTGEDDTLVIAMCAVDRNRIDAADGVTSGTGWTLIGTPGNTGGSGGIGSINASKDMATAGSTGALQFGTWLSDGYATVMVSLKSEPAGTRRIFNIS